jgi:hypothetical protein
LDAGVEELSAATGQKSRVAGVRLSREHANAMAASQKVRGLLITAALAVLFIASCSGIMALLTPKESQTSQREPVKEHTPASFPILFFESKDDPKPRIIRFEEFAVEQKKHPLYTLLIPEGKEQEINRWLRDSSESGGGQGNFAQDVTIEASSEGKQSLRVHVDPNDEYTTIGWYHATEKEFFPRYYEAHRGPAGIKQALKYGGAAFLITGSLFLLLGIMWRTRHHTRSA